MTGDDQAVALPDEPLVLSAPIARRLAAQLCVHRDARGNSCAAFHGAWQYLRLLDFITTPRDHAPFYLAALRPMIRAGRRRVLVSGAADYAMPAYVLWAFASERAAPDLTVVDVCETPLALCSWYAERVAARLSTHRSDILDYRPARPFEIICTHSLFSHFIPSRRPALIASWRELLEADGAVVTLTRIRPDAPETVGLSVDQVRAFRDRARLAAEAARARLDIEPDEIAAIAEDYASSLYFHPVRSTGEIQGLFEAAGFRIELLAVGPIPGAEVGPSGPTMKAGAHYARFVARRI